MNQVQIRFESEPLDHSLEAFPTVLCNDTRSFMTLLKLFAQLPPQTYGVTLNEDFGLQVGLGNQLGFIEYYDIPSRSSLVLKNPQPFLTEVLYFPHEGTATPYWPVDILPSTAILEILALYVEKDSAIDTSQFQRKYWGTSEDIG